MPSAVVLITAFFTTVTLTMGIYYVVSGSRLSILQRLSSLADDGSTQMDEVARERGVQSEFLRIMGILGRMVPRRSNLGELQKKLIHAQILMRAEEFIGLTIIVALLIFLFLFLVSGMFLVGLAGGILGLFLPGMFVDMKKKKKSDAITVQLSEALTIISNGLRSGSSFPQAMAIVSREVEPPISDEFSRVLRENQIGKPMDEALTGLLDRNDNDDLALMVTALLIQKQVGGNLAEVLDNISHTIRERVRIKGEIRTLTAEGRISALIIGLLPFGVAAVIAVMNPGYISTLVQDVLGIIMIILAVILQVTGILILRKIVNIEV